MGRFLSLFLLLTMILSGCAGGRNEAPMPVDAIVSQQVVNSDLPVFDSIQAAVNAASDQGWVIKVTAGNYHERVVIESPGITLIGDGQENTRIYYGRYAGQRVSADSEETWGTFRTATVQINASNVHLANLTIENSFNYPANEKLPHNHPDKVKGAQAVALKIAEQADQTIVENVQLLGYQDTVYVQGKRSYFYGGAIHGHVDFIFGNGNALFENVDIISRSRAKPHKYTGYVTAPSTLLKREYGFTFFRCRLLREPDVPDNSVPLGRPWHPTTTFPDGRYANPYAVGKATFIHTFMDAHIAQEGWASMGGTTKEGTRKQFDPLTEARFAEFNSTGPGAVVNAQRPQLEPDQVKLYTMGNIFANWQPKLLAQK